MEIIEKKYLLKENAEKWIKKSSFKKHRILQFYTHIAACKETRYRKHDTRYYKTLRIGNDIRTDEVIKEINKKTFKEKKRKKIGELLKKSRYQIDKKTVLDIYHDDFKNLLLLEVKFDNKNQLQTYTLPKNIRPFIKKDVSDDKRYRNKNLAKLGNPQKHPYNIYAIYKDIEQQRIKDFSTIIFPEMPVSDAVRIVLYRLYHALKSHSNALLEKNTLSSLEAFRITLKNAKIILKAYEKMFEKKMFKKVYNHLSMIEQTIAVDKDLSVIRTQLPLLEKTFDEKETTQFISKIDKRIESEKNKVKGFFKTREYAIILSQFELLLTEPSYIQSDYENENSIGRLHDALVKSHFKKLLKSMKKYDKCHDLQGYNTIKRKLIKTAVLIENFSALFGAKRYNKMCKNLRRTHQSLLEYIELEKRHMIITAYLHNSKKSLQEQRKLMQKIEKRKKSLEKEIHKRVDLALLKLEKRRALFL